MGSQRGIPPLRALPNQSHIDRISTRQSKRWFKQTSLKIRLDFAGTTSNRDVAFRYLKWWKRNRRPVSGSAQCKAMLPRTKSGVQNVEGPSAIKHQQGTATREATDEAKRCKNIHHLQKTKLAASQRSGRSITAAKERYQSGRVSLKTIRRDCLFDLRIGT